MTDPKPPSKIRPWILTERKRTRANKLFDEGGIGRKQCLGCFKFVGGPTKSCPGCGFKFKWVGQIKDKDTQRVKDIFARKQTLIDRITEVSDRADVEELINNVELKLKLRNEIKDDEYGFTNFNINKITKSAIDRNFIKIYNLSAELAWKLKSTSLEKIFSEDVNKYLKSSSQISFLVKERILIINIMLSKSKDAIDSEVESEADAKSDLDREERILQHLLQDNFLTNNPAKLIEILEASYKKNQSKKLKSIGWNWIEKDEDFIKKNCSVNAITYISKFIKSENLGEWFDYCLMDPLPE